MSSSFLPRRLNLERILQAAIQLTDQQGIDALSMRKLAQSLQVEAMSLYHHVRNKDVLLDKMVDAIIAEMPLPSPEHNWQEALRQRMLAAYQILQQHPWATQLIVSRLNIGPAMLRYLDASLQCLYEAGFDYQLADRALNALDSYLYGFALQQFNFPLEPTEYTQAARQFLPMIDPKRYPHFYGLTQLISTETYSGLADFDFGLNLMLDSLSHCLKANGGDSRLKTFFSD